MKRWLEVAYVLVALSPLLFVFSSQLEGWRGILVPDTAEWLCGKLGRSANNPFQSAAELAYRTGPIWFFLTIVAGGIAIKIGKLTVRPILSFGLIGLLANAFMLFGTEWMSDRYESVLSRQCGIYG